MNTSLTQKIEALLPQTQCTKCGFNGCLPYAEAIASQQTDINRCSPGGSITIQALADLLSKDPIPLAADVVPTLSEQIAVIKEEHCIGCTLCLKVCPVDAIIGAGKLMHTVLAEWCTGCELCIARCPVDCISMIDKPSDIAAPSAAENKQRYQFHQQRFSPKNQTLPTIMVEDKQSMINAALARAKTKKV
ncbi:MAG: RnfABCDGE type electron transport complex subunit B [Gammaproteobacteria bacterium]